MGATNLQELAGLLEKAIVKDKSPDGVKELLLDSFAVELDRLTAALKSLLPTAPEAGDEILPPLPDTVDVTAVTQVLNKLLGYIDSMDCKAERYLDDYQHELTGLPENEMRQIKAHLTNFDFPAAGTRLVALSAGIGIKLTTVEYAIATSERMSGVE